jgi:hypothetical protein
MLHRVDLRKLFLGCSMPARKALLPVTTGVEATIDFSVKDWRKIDRIYVTSLPDSAKLQIDRATANYIVLGTMEARALPASSAVSSIDELSNLIEKLRSRLSPNKLSSDTMFFLADYLQRNLRLPNVRPLGDQVGHLLSTLRSLQTTLDGAKEELKRNPDSQKYGLEWRKWIRALAQIIQNANMHTKGRGKSVSANNDIKFEAGNGRQAGMSCFVLLVAELQKELPRKLTHSTTDAALSKAIQRILAAD